jgi:hypothetical protein
VDYGIHCILIDTSPCHTQVLADRDESFLALLGTLAATQPEKKHLEETTRFNVEVDAILALCRERNLFTSLPRLEAKDEADPSKLEFTEDFVISAIMDAQTFSSGCVGGGLDSLEGGDGLSCTEFIELLARCGDVKYAGVQSMGLPKVRAPCPKAKDFSM